MPNLIPAKTHKNTISITSRTAALASATALLASLAFMPAAFADPDMNDAEAMQTPASQVIGVQDSEMQEPALEDSVIVPTKSDYFNAADFDNNGLLSRGEFELYVDTIADSGDAVAVSIRDNKSYSDAFSQADTSADDSLSLMELSHQDDAPKYETPPYEEPEITEPEL